MAMTTSTSKDACRAEINVTPMIDVLLVLLIIFMVVAPVMPRGLNALVPLPATSPIERSQDIVVDVIGPGAVELNHQPMGLAELNRQFRLIFQVRGEAAVIFVRGAGGLDYRDVAGVIDAARGAGLTRVGLMTAR